MFQNVVEQLGCDVLVAVEGQRDGAVVVEGMLAFPVGTGHEDEPQSPIVSERSSCWSGWWVNAMLRV